MAFDLKTLSGQNIAQLALDLNLEEVEGDGVISPAEAKRKSESMLGALKIRFKADVEALEGYERDQKEYKIKLALLNDSEKKKAVPPERPTKLYEWAEDFFLLLDRGWPWRVAVYIAWAGSPKIGRWPKTQEELANEVLGLTSDRQISEWRSKNPAIDEMIGIMQAMPLLSHRRDIFEALATSASNPSSKGAQDRKTALTLTGDYVPHLKIDQKREVSDPLDKSDAELDEIIKRGGTGQ
jgi:hypothetical protein